MQFERIGVASPTLQWVIDPVALVDSQTDTALTVSGIAYPFSGWVLGYTAILSAAVGAGALSIDLKFGATQQSIDTAIGVADTVVSATFGKGAYRFTAGQLVNVSYTSGVLTTNGNITVVLLVVLDDARP